MQCQSSSARHGGKCPPDDNHSCPTGPGGPQGPASLMPRGLLLSMMFCSRVWGSWATAWSRYCSSLLMLDTGMPKDCTKSSSCWGSRSCRAGAQVLSCPPGHSQSVPSQPALPCKGGRQMHPHRAWLCLPHIVPPGASAMMSSIPLWLTGVTFLGKPFTGLPRVAQSLKFPFLPGARLQ